MNCKNCVTNPLEQLHTKLSRLHVEMQIELEKSPHSSEIRGLRSTKCSSETLQKGNRTFAFGLFFKLLICLAETGSIFLNMIF